MKHAIVVAFSDEDEGYIATVPELPGCSAFGDTEEDATREVKVAASLWLSAAMKAGMKWQKGQFGCAGAAPDDRGRPAGLVHD